MGSDLTVVNAARVSFGAETNSLREKDIKLIKYLMENSHTSPFEHCAITMRFTVPLFIRSQHHRHRTWAYNEISRRYTSVDMQFYSPSEFRTQHKSNRQASSDELINPDLNSRFTRLLPTPAYLASEAVKSHNIKSLNLYDSLIKKGICREQARGVLPQNLYTEYYGTCNLNNLVKFLDLRLDSHAQWEIRRVAEACRDIARELWPEAMSHFSK